jgi:FAD/FMN-containing dehydrogenase
VAFALKTASDEGVAVTPFGAGTGLMGGAESHRPGIVLDTCRLDRTEVSAADRIVWAGAGAVLAQVDLALREHGLCLGHDPWTFPVATVGGAIGTNGLGYKGGRYGGMGDQVVALEVALADGSIVRTRTVSRSSTGPDLARLFIGAEGALGVVTAAALKAHSVPEREELRAYRFARFDLGFAAIDEMTGLGLRPSLLDYGEEHASPWPDLPGRQEEAPTLYLGFEGFAEEVAASLARAEAIVRSHAAKPLPQSEARAFWEDRHVVAERFSRARRGRRNSGWPGRGIVVDYLHVALPPSRVLEFRARCHDESRRADIALFECGLWTGPDLFSAVVAAREPDGGRDRLTETVDSLLRAAQDLGGSMEYCHGAGLRLAHLMEREHGPGLDLLRRLKVALDPTGVLNPGKLGL